MAGIGSVRDGLKARLATITGLYTYDTVPGSVNVPAAIVGMPSSIRFDVVFRSAVTRMQFPVRLLVGQAHEAEAQDRIDEYISADGASSVRAAIDGDGTLGGVAHTTRVVEVRDVGVYEVAGVAYLGADVLVEVIA